MKCVKNRRRKGVEMIREVHYTLYPFSLYGNRPTPKTISQGITISHCIPCLNYFEMSRILSVRGINVIALLPQSSKTNSSEWRIAIFFAKVIFTYRPFASLDKGRHNQNVLKLKQLLLYYYYYQLYKCETIPIKLWTKDKTKNFSEWSIVNAMQTPLTKSCVNHLAIHHIHRTKNSFQPFRESKEECT